MTSGIVETMGKLKYVAKEDDHGHWLIHDTSTPQHYPLPGYFTDKERAEAVAQRYNRIEAGSR